VLLEEPELSLHPAIIRVLPQVLAKAQSRNGSQVLLTTHSPDLLADEGVGLDEVLELELTLDGTIGRLLSVIPGIVQYWQDGISLSDIMRARSAPPGIERLPSVDLAAG
jgi:hypothetical protein